jgi:hypothetical protein
VRRATSETISSSLPWRICKNQPYADDPVAQRSMACSSGALPLAHPPHCSCLPRAPCRRRRSTRKEVVAGESKRRPWMPPPAWGREPGRGQRGRIYARRCCTVAASLSSRARRRGAPPLLRADASPTLYSAPPAQNSRAGSYGSLRPKPVVLVAENPPVAGRPLGKKMVARCRGGGAAGLRAVRTTEESRRGRESGEASGSDGVGSRAVGMQCPRD